MEYIVIVINIVFSLVLVSGIVMTMIGLPGNVLIVIAGIVYAYYDKFQNINYTLVLIIVGIFIASEIFEFIAGIIGAKQKNASQRAVIAACCGSLLGGVGGTMVLPIVGSLIGALAGAFISAAVAEYSRVKDKEQAKRVAIGVVKGQIIGMIIKTTTGICMVILLLHQLKWS